MKTFVVSEFVSGHRYIRNVCSTRPRAEVVTKEIKVENRVDIEEFELDTREVLLDACTR